MFCFICQGFFQILSFRHGRLIQKILFVNFYVNFVVKEVDNQNKLCYNRKRILKDGGNVPMTTTNGVQNAPITSKPSGFSVLDLCLIAMFAALLAICSWISIPAPPPLPVFTMQTFGVFVTLELLGGKRGFFSILTFVLLGAVGVPVFAGFSGGVSVLFGSTGGYILGFILTGALYWVLEATLGKKFWVRLTALIGGLALCYAFGTIWFMVVYGRDNGAIGAGTALMWCVVPYLIPDCAKLALALGISAAVKSRVKI